MRAQFRYSLTLLLWITTVVVAWQQECMPGYLFPPCWTFEKVGESERQAERERESRVVLSFTSVWILLVGSLNLGSGEFSSHMYQPITV